MFFFCGRAEAQFTLVSGTVTDTNGLAYSCGTLSASIVNLNGQSLYLNGVQFSPQPGATKLGCPTDPTTSRTPGAFTLQLADNTQIKCGSGPNIITCATQTQWLFTINSTGIQPPLGTGPQVCTAQFTISGATQTVAGSLSSCPALSTTVGSGGNITSGIYVSASCGALTNCFQVKADAQWVIDATFNATSTVTTTAGDIAFSAALDATKISFGNTGCAFSTAVSCATYACPQTTIASVNSAHSVTLSAACTASSSGSISVFVWTSDDGATLQAATAALVAKQTAKSGVPSNLFLPCGGIGTSVNPFIGNQISIPMSFSITGCGAGTVIVPFPKMNCNVGGGHGCLIDFPVPTFATNGVTPAGVIRDITFYGGGQNVHDPAATISANSSGIFVNFEYGLDNVWVIGWLSGEATIIGIRNIGGALWNSGSFAGGAIGCSFSGSLGTDASMHGGTCGGNGTEGFLVTQSTNANDETDFFGVYFQAGNGGPLVINSGVARIYGGTSLGNPQINGGTVYLDGISCQSGIFVTGGEAHLRAVRFTNACNLQQTGGNVFDDGGNNLPFSTFTTFTAGNPHGVWSVSGIADVAGNHVLSAGWGATATVTAVGGDTVDVVFTVNSSGAGQAASPTITDTFALGGGGFWKAPNTGCFLTQNAGTFAVVTNPVPSALSRTGVIWTFSGTPVSGQSYTFYRHCA